MVSPGGISLNTLNAVIWIIYYCHLSIGISGSTQMKMYSVNGESRAIGANITVVTNFSGIIPTMTAIFSVKESNNSSPIEVANIFFERPNYLKDERLTPLKSFPFLNMSLSQTSTTTREIEWFFSYLPGSYNGLELISKLTFTDSITTLLDSLVLNVSECPRNVGNASVQNCSSPCGYGCSCQFVCVDGYEYNSTKDRPISEMYVCSATANWDPSVQLDLCVPKPTTTETATTPTAPTTTPNGSTQGSGKSTGGFHTTSGPILAGIGGVLAAVCITLIVYMAINKTPNNVVLYVMSALCLCVWAIALGLCFGMSTNESAVIAGIVLGSLALVGMVVVIGFQISLLKSHKGKGIPGKPDKPDDRL